MTRDEWKSIHRKARLKRSFSAFGNYLFLRDNLGRMGVTKKHDNGHVIPQAAIANKLRYAAQERSYKIGHICFIEHIRLLRKSGTWFK